MLSFLYIEKKLFLDVEMNRELSQNQEKRYN